MNNENTLSTKSAQFPQKNERGSYSDERAWPAKYSSPNRHSESESEGEAEGEGEGEDFECMMFTYVCVLRFAWR